MPAVQSTRWAVGLALVACVVFTTARGDDPAKPAPPMQTSAKEDHKRMMELLNIKEIRRGANADRKAANPANYDESKANPNPDLPDPLVLKNGQKVTTAEMWTKQRRAEIVEDFDREVYGRVAKDTPKVKWEVTDTTKETIGDVPVVTKKLVGHVDNSSYPSVTVDIQLRLTTPANATGPVPVIMEFGFGGFGGKKGFALKPGKGGPGWQQQVVEKGWGFAIITPNSIQADTGGRVGKGGDYQGLNTGIIGLCNKGQPRKPDDWGALRAWAWGASRALDYFETDKAVDAKQVGIEGLSRYGKAAIVAMAYDERFAIGFIGSSGAGGVKLHRRLFGEQVENLASSGAYHWLAGNYIKYAGPLTAKDLPVDAHELVALCAPRPVFISVGAEKLDGNGWIDCKGNFLAGVGAGPVYKLLGKKDLGTAEFPAQETALIDGEIAFRQHAGGHTTGPNWPTFLKFADRYIKGPKPAGADK
jgi:(4-O-methyl)-D-glucuronate---lignin esterase